MNRRTAVKMFLSTVTTGLALAQRNKEDEWIYLGQANVDGKVDHDLIRVGADEGFFRAIQIRVERAPIEFNRVVVTYGDGRDQRIVLRNRIGPGDKTRAIDIQGDRRAIRTVDIWYERARDYSAKPRLTLWGRR